MPYYHNPTERIVYYVPDVPEVTKENTNPTKRNKRPRQEGWFVQTEIEITRADNFIEHGTNQWHYQTSKNLYEHYAPTDSKEQVVSWFKGLIRNHFPKMGNEISKEEYYKLKQLYEEEARKNMPPLS